MHNRVEPWDMCNGCGKRLAAETWTYPDGEQERMCRRCANVNRATGEPGSGKAEGTPLS